MATHVNLDAFIRREDFEVKSDVATPSELASAFKVSELEPTSLTYLTLRKPDFQRETNNWEPEKVVDLIQSFLEGDLIPAIILWRSDQSGNIFVIDGAHRLSALIAWVHDDYGDKALSRRFFDNVIPPEQERAAEATRKLVDKAIGSYEQLKLALLNPNTTPADKIRLAKNLSVFGIKLQWVQGDAKKAEKSFRAINQKATPIDKTELQMINDRRKPNALAARAIIRAGTGHKYWSAFADTIKDEIEAEAREIYKMLFSPDLETPIKTLDLPVAGQGYSFESVKLVFDFVDFANRNKRKQEEDKDGLETLEYLKTVRRFISRVTGTHSGSLGLHPAVYYYSATGRYQPAAFLATIDFIDELDSKKWFNKFTQYRSKFEEFILKYKYFINQIVQKYGSEERGRGPIVEMFRTVLEGVSKGLDDAAIVAELQQNERLRFLREVTEEDVKYGRNFSGNTKSAAFLKEALSNPVRCRICHARVHKNSISIDHNVRKADGGIGSLDNANVTHPYCNSGFKESRHVV